MSVYGVPEALDPTCGRKRLLPFLRINTPNILAGVHVHLRKSASFMFGSSNARRNNAGALVANESGADLVDRVQLHISFF